MPENPTPAQREASRRNGARSRGPRSEAGKARIAAAATRHGLCGGFRLLPGEEARFRRLRAGWRARLRPRDAVEEAAVDKLVFAVLREHRLEAIESRLSAALATGAPAEGLPSLATLLRYRARIERDRRRALAELAFARGLRRSHETRARTAAPREDEPPARASGLAAGAASTENATKAAADLARSESAERGGTGAEAPRAAEGAGAEGRDARVRAGSGGARGGAEALFVEIGRELARLAPAGGAGGLCARSGAGGPLSPAWSDLDRTVVALFGAPLTAAERARLEAAARAGAHRARGGADGLGAGVRTGALGRFPPPGRVVPATAECAEPVKKHEERNDPLAVSIARCYPYSLVSSKIVSST
ncbi:MAG: hypothetical protein NZP72_02205 [Geminicoccaceae bacterium]|nr:hypothetical protein [Geminicoccaceae bacterium]